MVAPALVDTHCHLTFGELGADPDRYVANARAVGVEEMILIGIDPTTSAEVVEFVGSRDGLWAAVGVHPNETSKVEADAIEQIRELAEGSGAGTVVAIGESGLDFYWKESTPAQQERSLERHVELALELDLPLVLHIRDAYPRAADLLAVAAERDGLRGVIHCFGGLEEEVDPFLDWGWPISFSGILTYGKADNIRGAARRTPLEQCLLETDAPWLTPAAERGKTNEPAFVVHTARRLAEVKEVSFETVAEVTTANARRVFSLE